MTDNEKIMSLIFALDEAMAKFEADLLAAGAYMPALATRLRLYADDLADKYPDDTNGGSQ